MVDQMRPILQPQMSTSPFNRLSEQPGDTDGPAWHRNEAQLGIDSLTRLRRQGGQQPILLRLRERCRHRGLSFASTQK
jgi:hypothetical protein